MDDKQFEHLTEPRDRRGEFPEASDLEINDSAEEAAFQMHAMWCQEANHFKTPEAYARSKLGCEHYSSEKKQVQITVEDESGQKSIVDFWVASRAKEPNGYATAETKNRPEPLWELLGTTSLFMLNDEQWSSVVNLANCDGEVWYYVREWYMGQITGDPPPLVTSSILTPLVRDMVAGNKPDSQGKPPVVGYSDEMLLSVATAIQYRFGCSLSGRISAIGAATGLSEGRTREKLADAGKGTSKRNYVKKVKKRNKKK